jgi:hypothetical protein
MIKGLLAAGAVLACLSSVPASAQAIPGGSYIETCTHVHRYGDRLFADCRRVDGRWQRSALNDVDRCRGGIANTNGHLTCNQGRHWGGGYGSSRYQHNYWYGR